MTESMPTEGQGQINNINTLKYMKGINHLALQGFASLCSKSDHIATPSLRQTM